jgi:Domain of unknown function (DUF1918)
MANRQIASTARVGDWIEARGLHGQPSRRDRRTARQRGREHYRVRWDDQHESIAYPTDGVIITAQARIRGALAEESA